MYRPRARAITATGLEAAAALLNEIANHDVCNRALRHDRINGDSFLAYIYGIGEKFGANPVTGTGSVDLPLCFSPGLALHYVSGGGNGPFGFGWTLSLPAITPKTELGQRQPFPTPPNSIGLGLPSSACPSSRG